MKTFVLSLILSTVAVAALSDEPAKPILHEMFTDNAVLQRGQTIPVWGDAKAGEGVSVTWKGKTFATKADKNGYWRVNLPASEASPTETLSVTTTSGQTQTVNNIAVGDVFLCSGQSNMVFEVKRSLNAPSEIGNSTNPNVRMMTVANRQAFSEQRHFITPTKWQVAGPDVVGDWSAACYYFGRDIQKTENVPVGLITSAWGGSNIKVWLDADSLTALGGFDEQLQALSSFALDKPKAMTQWGHYYERWWQREGGAGTPWTTSPSELKSWNVAGDMTQNWETWGVPELADFNGGVWFGKTVTLTAAQAKGAATLELGLIDDIDQTWVNGQPVGNGSGAGEARVYPLSDGALKEGDNTIIVHVTDVYARGGFYGPVSRQLKSANGAVTELGSDWHYYKPEKTWPLAPRAPWDPTGGLATLNNAMIAPMGPYGLKGVLWYQGESNTGDGRALYGRYMTTLMKQWRQQFESPNLSFLLIELANYGPRTVAPENSGWAEVREALRLTAVNDAHSAYVVAIDIGDYSDIHPANKNVLGLRLSRAARSVIYHKDAIPSGPEPLFAEAKSDMIMVGFDRVEKGLIAYSAAGPIGFELCDNSHCVYAKADLKGTQVALSIPEGLKPTKVRYCWADSPVCNLFDRNGLPVTPFELGIQTK